MRANSIGSFFLVTALVITGTGVSTWASDDLSTLVNGNNAFTLDMYQQLKTMDGNLFFSPYSMSSALAMTYAGARENTADEMASVLHFTLGEAATPPAFAKLNTRLETIQTKNHVQLQVANSLWPQAGYPIIPAYLELLEKFYDSTITALDYKNNTEEARVTINTWVEDKTQDKIKDLIAKGMLDPMTRMVLVNAIYFKGNWASQFKTTDTKEMPFYVAVDREVQAELMTRKGDYKYAEFEDIQVVELPYVGDDLSMIILLPTEKNGLSDIESKLTTERLNEWTARLESQEVRVFLPKFKITWGTISLNQALTSLGMVAAFDAGKANFSGMDKQNAFFISDVVHKAFIEVNEEGTEAAAATAVVMRMTAMPAPVPLFKADHPFLFLIRENKTLNILFMGRVTNP